MGWAYSSSAASARAAQKPSLDSERVLSQIPLPHSPLQQSLLKGAGEKGRKDRGEDGGRYLGDIWPPLYS